jgi:hypothetical protein
MKHIALMGSSSDAKHYMCQSNRIPNLESNLSKIPYKMRESRMKKTPKKIYNSFNENMSNMHFHNKEFDE